jgi:hypothetical protein
MPLYFANALQLVVAISAFLRTLRNVLGNALGVRESLPPELRIIGELTQTPIPPRIQLDERILQYRHAPTLFFEPDLLNDPSLHLLRALSNKEKQLDPDKRRGYLICLYQLHSKFKSMFHSVGNNDPMSAYVRGRLGDELAQSVYPLTSKGKRLHQLAKPGGGVVFLPMLPTNIVPSR